MIFKAKESAATDSDKQFEKTIRLGRKTDEDINRLLQVSFKTEQDVIEINQVLPKLKGATAEIRNLRMSTDRSLKKRRNAKPNYESKKNLNDQEEGNYVYLVRGTQILKVEKKARLEN